MGRITSQQQQAPKPFRWVWELVAKDGTVQKTLVKRYESDRRKEKRRTV
jgi:hypothetical protein